MASVNRELSRTITPEETPQIEHTSLCLAGVREKIDRDPPGVPDYENMEN